MRKFANFLIVEGSCNIQIEYEPSSQWFRRVKISWNMNVIVKCRIQVRVKFSVDVFAELLADLDMSSLGAASYIGHSSIDGYPSRLRTHDD